MHVARTLVALIAVGLLAGCQIPPPRALDDPASMPSPGSIAYVPGQLPPPPGTGWTTPQHQDAGPLQGGYTVRVLGMPVEIPESVIRRTQLGRDGRVGDAVERRTRVGGLRGGPAEFILTYRTDYQWGRDLDGGGGQAPDLWTNQFRVSWEQPLPLFGRFGLFGEYTNRKYEFHGENGFIPGTDDPWGTAHRIVVGANLFQPFHEQWAFVLAGDLRWHVEDGASLSDGMSWSLTAGVGWRPSKTLDLGAGFVVQDSFADDLFFIGGPQVDWRPNERWRFAIVGTELEIQHSLNNAWQIGGGGGFTGHRFRLDGDGPGANQIAAESRFPIYLQARYRGVEDLDLTWRVGVDVTREFRIEDANGNTLRRFDSDPSPYVSFRAIWRL